MKEIAVAEAAFAGVGIIRRHPAAVVVWGVLFVAFLLIVMLGFAGPFAKAFTVLSDPALAREDPQAVLAALSGAAGGYFFFLLGALVLGAVITGAVMRAFFHPEDSGFFYVRLGTRELWLLLTTFVQSLVIACVQLVAGLPVSVVSGLVSMASPGAGTAVNVVGQLLLYLVGGYVYVRLAMAPAMTFTQSRFRLFESWPMTRGHVLKMVLVWLLVLAMSLAIYFIAVVVLAVAAGGIIMNIPGLKDPVAFFERPVAEWAAVLAPALAIGGAIFSVVIGMIAALGYAPFAHIYRQLNPDADTAATFS